jgi:glycosyltransferase involved in cell wall biosynthesis
MRLAKQSTGVIVTNHEDHQRLQSLPHRALIPIGSNIVAPLEQVDRSHWRQQAHAADGDFLIAYFGLANATKGIDTLIAGLSQLRGQGIPAHLVMIGSVAGSSDPTNQAFSAQLNAIIQRSNMNTFIHQTGFIPDEAVGVYLTAADVVALPFRDGASFRRGSLMAPIHYGCAIVTTTPGVAIPEFVNGENLLLVPSDNADALALALKQVYDSAALRDRLKAGATALRPLFDWGSIARRTADYLRQVAQ